MNTSYHCVNCSELKFLSKQLRFIFVISIFFPNFLKKTQKFINEMTIMFCFLG